MAEHSHITIHECAVAAKLYSILMHSVAQRNSSHLQRNTRSSTTTRAQLTCLSNMSAMKYIGIPRPWAIYHAHASRSKSLASPKRANRCLSFCGIKINTDNSFKYTTFVGSEGINIYIWLDVFDSSELEVENEDFLFGFWTHLIYNPAQSPEWPEPAERMYIETKINPMTIPWLKKACSSISPQSGDASLAICSVHQIYQRSRESTMAPVLLL